MTNSAAVSLNLNNNIVRNLSKSAASVHLQPCRTGAVLSSISINGNQLGNDSGGLITYSAANSATLLGISNTSGTANCNLSIQNNDIRNTHILLRTNAHTYIINSFATLSQNISGNTLLI
jgi:hypothetical protein